MAGKVDARGRISLAQEHGFGTQARKVFENQGLRISGFTNQAFVKALVNNGKVKASESRGNAEHSSFLVDISSPKSQKGNYRVEILRPVSTRAAQMNVYKGNLKIVDNASLEIQDPQSQNELAQRLVAELAELYPKYQELREVDTRVRPKQIPETTRVATPSVRVSSIEPSPVMQRLLATRTGLRNSGVELAAPNSELKQLLAGSDDFKAGDLQQSFTVVGDDGSAKITISKPDGKGAAQLDYENLASGRTHSTQVRVDKSKRGKITDPTVLRIHRAVDAVNKDFRTTQALSAEVA